MEVPEIGTIKFIPGNREEPTQIVLSGDFEPVNEHLVQRMIIDIRRAKLKTQSVILDCSKVEYVQSSSWRMIQILQAAIKMMYGHYIFHSSPAIDRMIEIHQIQGLKPCILETALAS